MTAPRLSSDLDVNLVRSAPLEQIPALIGQLEALKAAAYSRLMSERKGEVRDESLSARQVAERLGVGKDWVYEHRAELPFAWRKGKMLRFSSAGLEAWMTERQRSAGDSKAGA